MKRILPVLSILIGLTFLSSCNREDEQWESNAHIIFNYSGTDNADAVADKDFITYTLDNEIAKGKNKRVYAGGYYIEDYDALKDACESALKKMDGRSWSMTLGFAIKDNDDVTIWTGSVKAAKGNAEPWEVEYVDLGLSCLWSDKNLGPDWCVVNDWVYDDAYNAFIPNQDEWEELVAKCECTVSPDGKGLIFSGNGNSIFISCTDSYRRDTWTICGFDMGDIYSGFMLDPTWAPDATGAGTPYALRGDEGSVLCFFGANDMHTRDPLASNWGGDGWAYGSVDRGRVRLIKFKD